MKKLPYLTKKGPENYTKNWPATCKKKFLAAMARCDLGDDRPGVYIVEWTLKFSPA